MEKLVNDDPNDLTIPAFLDRKIIGPTSPAPDIKKLSARDRKLVWPKKKDWARVTKLERLRAKRDGTLLKIGTFAARSGQ